MFLSTFGDLEVLWLTLSEPVPEQDFAQALAADFVFALLFCVPYPKQVAHLKHTTKGNPPPEKFPSLEPPCYSQ